MAAYKTWRRITALAIGASGAFVALFAVIFQDSIVRFLSMPRAPFQTLAAPAAPDYELPDSWLEKPETPAARPVDIFYIHSTTFSGRKHWNAPVEDEASWRMSETIALPNEAGPFTAIGEIYAPRYRQATLYAQFTHKFDGLAARRLAYGDVRRAFEHFLSVRDPERPLALVGYGQGGLYAQGLLNDFFQAEINPLRRRLVAAYVIGAAAPVEFLKSLNPAMPVCRAADDVRCLVSYVDLESRFDEEMERIRSRALEFSPSGELVSLKSERTICVNPLSWREDGAYASAEANLGAASATGLVESAPAPIAKAVGARCENGILVVDTPKRRMLRRGDWFGAKWKPQPFNLFYYDLAENAAVRTGALQRLLETEPEPLEPIGEILDVVDSPINRAPE